MEKLNIADLLKDCPRGMELDCTMYSKVILIGVNDIENRVYPIKVIREDGHLITLTKYGQYRDLDFAKCVIFPKGKTTWEGFQRPFKNGDIVKYLDSIFIFKEWGDETLCRTYVTAYLHGDSTVDIAIPLFGKSIRREVCFATEEEKQKLFNAVKVNGYKWNSGTKTLEKLIPNKFDITTLNPFDKVLVRDNYNEPWNINYFSYIDSANMFKTIMGTYLQCIPYKNNEYLLGIADNCDNYYKTWK